MFVRIDMEDRETTDATFDAYEACAREHDGNVGVRVQANLKRTLTTSNDSPTWWKVRLVTGAYDEPEAIACGGKARVDEAHRDCLAYVFEQL